VIINDDAELAANQMAAIVFAERARLSRQERKIKNVVEAFMAKEEGNSN
jgi:hypothetical protein